VHALEFAAFDRRRQNHSALDVKFRLIHTSRNVPGGSPSVGPGQKRGVFGAIKRELFAILRLLIGQSALNPAS
jgi:hypothetical protein